MCIDNSCFNCFHHKVNGLSLSPSNNEKITILGLWHAGDGPDTIKNKIKISNFKKK